MSEIDENLMERGQGAWRVKNCLTVVESVRDKMRSFLRAMKKCIVGLENDRSIKQIMRLANTYYQIHLI